MNKLIAKASTADVYTWGDGRVLKIFHEHTPWHANEVNATKVAHAVRLPVPEVIEGLVEVNGQEGIIFEQIDGPTMTEYIEKHTDKVEYCAQQAAELHARIHSTEVMELPPLVEVLSWSVQQANPLEEMTRKTILEILNQLPTGSALCHNDFYPNNLMMSLSGPIIIDWAIGTRGNPLADLARTWLISRLWRDGLETNRVPEHVYLWGYFWDTYFRRYQELRPFNTNEFNLWRIVAATASLVWDQSVTSSDQRVNFVKAALDGKEHAWTNKL